MRGEVMPSLIRPGGDLVEATNAQLGIRLGDLEGHAVDITRRRIWLAVWVFTLIFTLLGARLAHLTVGGDGPMTVKRNTQPQVAQERPYIVDRNGVLLATQISAYNLGADARKVEDVEEMVAALAAILPGLNRQKATQFLSSNRRYVELMKGLTPQQYKAVLTLGNPALKMEKADRRFYPHGSLASHMLGFVGSDMQGLAGLEFFLDRSLEPLSQESLRDGRLPVTLDIRVQHSVRAELAKSIKKFSATGGSAIVMDVENGNILSMVSLPDFDPNLKPWNAGHQRLFNKATLGTYELGSVFKIFTASMVLETGAAAPEDTFQTSLPISIGRHEITDPHGEKRPLTVGEIVVHSSNIGSAQLALSVTPEVHWGFLERLGLIDKPELEIPELTNPQLPRQWGEVERATSSYGYGISISPLQALVAGAAMVNGGVMYRPRLINDDLPLGVRVISEETSTHMRQIMRAVVTHGTAKNARNSKFMILGKTGTARMAGPGGYDSSRLMTSFLGAFPAHSPRYAFIVILHEPQKIDGVYGTGAGWNVVPLSTDIVERIAPLLGVMPHPAYKPADNIILHKVREVL